MMHLQMLDVFIGLVTIYSMFGMICTAMVESVNTALNMRSKKLEEGLEEFFYENGSSLKEGHFLKEFYAHPLIQSLSKGVDGKPSYIPAETVGIVVHSLLSSMPDKDKNLSEMIQEKFSALGSESRIARLFIELAGEAQNDVETFRKLIETHFDQSMERVSGWFKRHTQQVSLLVALFLSFALNIDSVSMVNELSRNDQVRVQMIGVAQAHVDDMLAQRQALQAACPSVTADNNASASCTPAQLSELKALNAQLDKTRESLGQTLDTVGGAGLPLGWQLPAGWGWPELRDHLKAPEHWNWVALLSKFFGLLVSAFAISLGAPFWFDLLQRFMQVRTALVPGEKKEQPSVK